ncbi:MAG: hypothetical protein ACK5MT_04215 [Actinomycetales bacterium]
MPTEQEYDEGPYDDPYDDDAYDDGRGGGRRRPGVGCWLVVVAVLVGLVAAGWFTRTQPLLSNRCVAVVGQDSYDLQPDQARNAALISAVSIRRGLPARAASIAIATAIQESKLRNIDYGDRDSLGLFQQRPSQGWGTPAQIMDPIYSTNAFYDALVKIDGYEQMVITEVAQAVQRSAFPDAYGFHEPAARAFASALTGHSPGGLTCRLRPLELATEAASSSGFTPRADAVRSALEVEAGLTRVSVGEDSRTLVVTTGSDTGSWATASWAVASADDLQVASVSVDGQTWQRGSDSQWTDDPDAPTDGTVHITVA